MELQQASRPSPQSPAFPDSVSPEYRGESLLPMVRLCRMMNVADAEPRLGSGSNPFEAQASKDIRCVFEVSQVLETLRLKISK